MGRGGVDTLCRGKEVRDVSPFGQRTHRNRWKEEETRKRKGPETRAETKELRGVAGNLQDVNVYSAP